MIQTPSACGWDGPTIAALCMSTTAVLIAGASVVVSYLAFRSETDPDVVLYAQADVGRPSIINLIIENKGRASAEKITFEWSGKLPARAWGVQSGGKDSSETMNEGPLVQGIPSLPAGDKRVITWGQYGGLYDALAGGAKDIVIRFRSKSRLLSRYRTHETTCSLDIRSFEATDASDRNWAKKIAENLDELKRSIEKESQDWLRRLDTTHEHGLPARNMRKAGDGETGGADG